MFFWKSDQSLFSLLQKETEWQSNFFVKMAGTQFCSTNDPPPVPLWKPLGQGSYLAPLRTTFDTWLPPGPLKPP